MKLAGLCAVAVAATAGTTNAQGFFDPPSKPFQLFSTNNNDGYSGSRGVFFDVTSPVKANDYCWTNDMPANSQLTWELQENGITVDTEFSTTGAGGYTDYSVSGNGFLMTPGNKYEISIAHNDNGVGNYFYNYDAGGDPPFNVGVFHVTDGTAGHNGSNTVMPRMGVDCAVPSPASGALLGLGGLISGRRRR